MMNMERTKEPSRDGIRDRSAPETAWGGNRNTSQK